MIVLLLTIQLGVADSAYSREALRTLVAEVAAANRLIPSSLATYAARVESEIALVQIGGRDERVTQLEHVASELRWQNPNALEQRIVGYRAGSPSLAVSALTYLRQPWIAPTLYGNHLRLLLSPRVLLGRRDEESTANGKFRLLAIHPLADDRDRVYWFDGGDVVNLQLPDGRILRVIRLTVAPRIAPAVEALLFRGELDVDPISKQVVRMRGQLVVTAPNPSRWERLVRRGLRIVAVAELINAEVDGSYWLPAYQRIEVQARSPLVKDFRAVLRITSRFQNHAVNDSGSIPCRGILDRRVRPVECLVVAPRDSLGRYSNWTADAGVATAARSSEFDDVMSEAWGLPKSPPLDSLGQSLADSAHSSRAKRAYVGIADRFRSRPTVRGLKIRADARRAGSDGGTRGALALEWKRVPWRSSLRVERPLLRGNGFFLPMLGGQQSVIDFSLGTDARDRRSATSTLTRELGGARGVRLRMEAGPASDPAESMWSSSSSSCAPWGPRPGVAGATGRNLRGSVALDFHPSVSGNARAAGIGGGLTYDRVDCGLRGERIEGRLLARHTRGAMTYAARLDAAAVTSWRMRPQQPWDLRTYDGFRDRAYDRVGRQRAALLRLSAAYELPNLTIPIRSLRWIPLPSVSPSIAIGLQSGWAEERRMRSAVSLTIQPFGGAFGFGVARVIDHAPRWAIVFATERW